MHIGNNEFYFALQEAHLDTIPKKANKTYINYGFNHIGLIVHHIDDIEKLLLEPGYNKGIDTPKEKFRKRIYYYDNAGFEWELVAYLSENLEDKFLYE
jgi:hypothetical protein